MNEALFRRNVEACENARHPECVCHCGGAMHGKKHPAAWQTETWSTIEAERAEKMIAEKRALDLFPELL